MVAVMASQGHTVVGVDTDLNRVMALCRGDAPVAETGLQELILSHQNSISATPDCALAVTSSDITFVVVPTPIDLDGQFSLCHVRQAMREIGCGIASKSGFHLVVLSSTVMPGACDQVVLPLLERISGKKCGEGFGLCYNPEFIALGSAIRDLLNPDLIVIGESDSRSGQMLSALYATICDSQPRVCRMNFVNAEVVKLSINTFVTMKMSFANMLGEICEHLPGADIDIVTDALGSDSRIGPGYLKGATAYGGPCFSRDNTAFSAFATAQGCCSLLPQATDLTNRYQTSRVTQIVKTHLPPGGTVGILGLSYKPNTAVVDASPGIALASELARLGCKIIVHDPRSMPGAAPLLPPGAVLAEDLESCAMTADVLVVVTPWPEYASLRPECLLREHRRAVVIDCWRILSRKRLSGISTYLAIGMGPCRDAVAAQEP
jgi:UDPglucose 6-dehydrogenase